MDNELKQLLLMILKRLQSLDSEVHDLTVTLGRTSARASAMESGLTDFKASYDTHFAGLQAASKPRADDDLLPEIQKAIDRLSED